MEARKDEAGNPVVNINGTKLRIKNFTDFAGVIEQKLANGRNGCQQFDQIRPELIHEHDD